MNKKISVLLRVHAATKEELIRTLLKEQSSGLDTDWVYEKILERERMQSTLLEDGLFFPHARLENLEEMHIVVATLDQPLQEARVAVLMLIPERDPMEALKFLAGVAGAARRGALTKLFDQSVTETEALAMLHSCTRERGVLTANDILRPCTAWVEPETALRTVTHNMMRWNLDCVPVLKEGCLVGEITCDRLFQLGVPDFFTQLQSVGFIRQFDPFEAYFQRESRAKACDVMDRGVRRYPPDMTLIEIVYEITVRRVPQLCICKPDGTLAGLVTRNSLLERIINL